MSKEEGRAREKSSGVTSQEQTKPIYDYEYVKDRFFFLDDPARPASRRPGYVVAIQQGSVYLYLDDGDGPVKEDFATTPGHAVLDLDGRRPGRRRAAGPYYFQQLEYGTDYTVLRRSAQSSRTRS